MNERERYEAAMAEIRAVKNNGKRRRMMRDLDKMVRKVRIAVEAKKAKR